MLFSQRTPSATVVLDYALVPTGQSDAGSSRELFSMWVWKVQVCKLWGVRTELFGHRCWHELVWYNEHYQSNRSEAFLLQCKGRTFIRQRRDMGGVVLQSDHRCHTGL